MSETEKLNWHYYRCRGCGEYADDHMTAETARLELCERCLLIRIAKERTEQEKLKKRFHTQHNMRETSLLSYVQTQETSLGEMQRLVYDAIRNYATPPTDREIAKALSLTDPNAVRPRRNELMEQGFIVEAGKRKCTVTGRLALTWRVKK